MLIPTAVVGQANSGAVILVPDSSTRNVIVPSNGTFLALVIKAATGQTEDLFQAQSSTGTILARMNELGWIGVGVDPTTCIEVYQSLVAPTAGPLTQSLGGISSNVDFTSPASFVSGNTVYLNDFTGTVIDRLDTNGYDHIYALRAAITMKAPTVPASGDDTGVTAFRFQGISDVTNTYPLSFLEGIVGFASHQSTQTIQNLDGIFSSIFANGLVGESNEMILGYGGAYGGITQPLWRGISIVTPFMSAVTDVLTQFEGITIHDNGDNFGDGSFVNYTGMRFKTVTQPITGTHRSVLVDAGAGDALFNDAVLLGKTSAPADADIPNSTGAWWWDATNSTPKWKGKKSDGTVVNFTPKALVTGQLYLSAAGMWPSTTNGAAANAKVESATNKENLYMLDFADGATVLNAEATVAMPVDWNGGTITAQFYWTANDTSTNAAVWGCQAVSYNDASTIDVAFGTAQTVTDNDTATANQVLISAATSAITIAGAPTAGSLVQFRVFRDPTNGSDNLAATARLLGVMINYTRT